MAIYSDDSILILQVDERPAWWVPGIPVMIRKHGNNKGHVIISALDDKRPGCTMLGADTEVKVSASMLSFGPKEVIFFSDSAVVIRPKLGEAERDSKAKYEKFKDKTRDAGTSNTKYDNKMTVDPLPPFEKLTMTDLMDYRLSIINGVMDGKISMWRWNCIKGDIADMIKDYEALVRQRDVEAVKSDTEDTKEVDVDAELRKIALDPTTPGAARLSALDKLAKMNGRKKKNITTVPFKVPKESTS